MKKIITLLLVFALAVTALSADANEDFINEYNSTPDAYSGIGSGFRHANPEILGMGGAGVALMESDHAFYLNPASITEGRFRLSLPSSTLTIYHVYDFLKPDSNDRSFIDKVMNMSSASDEENIELLSEALNIIGTQFSPMLRFDASTGLIIPIGKFAFGLNVDVTDTVYTYSGSIIDEVNSQIALGLGYKLEFGNLSLSLGLDGKYSILAFNRRIRATDFIDFDGDFALTVASGAAPLFDFGATLKYKGWSVGAALRDINFSDYRMNVITEKVSDTSVSTILESGDDFTVRLNPNLTMGFGYTIETNIVDVKAAFDLNDIISLAEYSGAVSGKAFFKHINAGVEVGLLNTLYLRAGVSSGYYTAGVSFDIFLIRIDAAYYWKEMGDTAGQRGLDGLSIRFNVGCER